MSPEIRGLPISVTFLQAPRAYRGKLLSGKAGRGREVHAGSFLRQRQVILDSALRGRPRELARILVHELFHFAWVRLGNPRRLSYEELLRREIRTRAKGELGWSAESKKMALTREDREGRTRRWREYVCESFCDTGAWLFAGCAHHQEFTLPARARRARRQWFEQTRLTSQISV